MIDLDLVVPESIGHRVHRTVCPCRRSAQRQEQSSHYAFNDIASHVLPYPSCSWRAVSASEAELLWDQGSVCGMRSNRPSPGLIGAKKLYAYCGRVGSKRTGVRSVPGL